LFDFEDFFVFFISNRLPYSFDDALKSDYGARTMGNAGEGQYLYLILVEHVCGDFHIVEEV
jgi:hypothetical protein